MHHKGQEVRNSAVLTDDVMKSLLQKVDVRSHELSQQRKGRKAQLSKLGRAVGRPNWAGLPYKKKQNILFCTDESQLRFSTLWSGHHMVDLDDICHCPGLKFV